MASTAPDDDLAEVPPPVVVEAWRVEHAIATLEPGQTVIVDLDETLWLRNSTEAYLASIRPRWLVAAVLMVLEGVPFWRLFGRDHESAEDWLRVVVCTVAFPWALASWRRRVRHLGPLHRNDQLATMLAGRAHEGPLVIATRGFRPVVGPLVESLDLPPHQLVACRFLRGRSDRASGKDTVLLDEVGADLVAGSVVITDSTTDAPLLDRCAIPLLHRWPEARYERAPITYAPFAYTELYKRAGQRYVFHIVIGRDLLLWVAATASVATAPLAMHLPGMVLLLVSFWCVYEICYLENDRVAERYEVDPVLPDRPLPGWRFTAGAWLWASALGAAGAALVRPDETALAILSWAAVLLVVRIVFAVYNHLDKRTRPVLYVALQAARLLAPLALVPMDVGGLVALLILAWSRSLLYAVYRVLRGSWIFVPHELINLAQLVIAYAVLWRAGVPLDPVVVVAFVGIFAVFARGEARSVLRTIHPITASSPPASREHRP